MRREVDDLRRQVLDELRQERAEQRLAEERRLVRAALAALGEDTYAEHDVVRFQKVFSELRPEPYTYAAIKCDGRWYVTGRYGERHGRGVTWDEFTEWLVSGRSVTELTLLMPHVEFTDRFVNPLDDVRERDVYDRDYEARRRGQGRHDRADGD